MIDGPEFDPWNVRTEDKLVRVLETVTLFGLVFLAALRPLITETYDSAPSAVASALAELTDPSPARTLFFDLGIVLCLATGLIARRLAGPKDSRRTGLKVGTVLVVAAVVVSCVSAGNKRLALNASVDWLSHLCFTIALVPLLDRPERRRILLAAVLASACAQAVQCFDQYFVGFHETWEHYQSIKAQFWAHQGIELDAPQVELFENRMRAHEASGFFPHSNVAGSYFVLCGFAAAGAALDAWKSAATWADRLRAAGCAGAAMMMFVACGLTHSRGAMASGAAGLALWMIVVWSRRWIDRHRRRAFVLGWSVVGLGLTAVVLYGLAARTLPGASLAFRWQYWTASRDLIEDHAFTGVGRENFGRHYLQYKSIDSPEEIANPHNLFVQTAADWGVLGLIGITALLVGGSWAIARSGTRTTPLPPREGPGEGVPSAREGQAGGKKGGPMILFLWTVTVGALVIAVRSGLLGTSDPNFRFVSRVQTGLPWLFGLCLFAGSLLSRDYPRKSARYARIGAAVGLFAFLVHEMINFALFVPGTAVTFFALFAYCVSETETPIRECKRSRFSTLRRRPAIPAALAGCLAVGGIVLLPVWRAAGQLKEAKRLGSLVAPLDSGTGEVDRQFRTAAAADPLDPTPYLAYAEWLATAAPSSEPEATSLRRAVDALDRASKRDPFGIAPRRMQVRVCQLLAARTGDAEDHRAAVTAAQRALELYPLDPPGLVTLADCQLAAGQAARSADLLQEAAENYQKALQLDDSRPDWERIRRFRVRERDEIQKKIRRAKTDG